VSIVARLGRLGCTITKKFVWGIEVTNTSGTFRGTVTTPKDNGIIVRINGDEIRWAGTMKGAVRFLRKAAHRNDTESHDILGLALRYSEEIDEFYAADR
jgi:hypothetical protein